MATLKTNSTEIYYEDQGPKDGPCIVLSTPVYMDGSFYEPLVDELKDEFRVITYDHRGHSRSAPLSKRPDIESTTQDAVKLIEHLKLDPCHFVGNGLGAHVGLHLAVRRPDLLKSCTLMGALPEGETDSKIKELDRFFETVKHEGMKNAVQTLMQNYCGESFLTSSDPQAEICHQSMIELLLSLTPHQIDNIKQVYHRPEISKAELNSIGIPVLILVGDEDTPERISAYRRLAENITYSTYETVHEAGYLTPFEKPQEVAMAIRHQIQNADLMFNSRALNKNKNLKSKHFRF